MLPASSPGGFASQQRPNWASGSAAGDPDHHGVDWNIASAPPQQRPAWATGSAAGDPDSTLHSEGLATSIASSAALDSGGFLRLSGHELHQRNSRSSDDAGDGESFEPVMRLSGVQWSQAGGSSGSSSGAGGAAASGAGSLSGVVTAVQRGVSRAGRSVSGAVARLSMPGLSGYERVTNAGNLGADGGGGSSLQPSLELQEFGGSGRSAPRHQDSQEEVL
jgi:hypothetical protein